VDDGVNNGRVMLSLVVLRVADLAASQRFYEQLGLGFHPEQHGRGPQHLSTVIGGTVLELYPMGSGPSTQGLRLGLLVPDLTNVAVSCATAVVDEIERDGRRVIVLSDPDGHKVEVTEAVA
jgi:catechol 2,3-dioxygenase-like lactoylglutathione lyase family enzyme